MRRRSQGHTLSQSLCPNSQFPCSSPLCFQGWGRIGPLCCSNSGIIFPPPPILAPGFPPPTVSVGWAGVGAEGEKNPAVPPTAACLLPHEPCSISRLCRATERRPTREVQPHSHPQGLPLPLAGVHQLPGLPERWQKSHPQPFPVSKFQQVRRGGGSGLGRHC